MSTYFERKIAGVCTRCGRAAKNGYQLCRRHLAAQRGYNVKSARKTRRIARKAKRCVHCKRRKVTRRGASCLACRIKRNRYRALLRKRQNGGVENGVEKMADRMVLRPDGRSRFSGKGTRGRTSSKVIDDQDLEYAIDAFTKAKEGLALARSEASEQLPPSERRAAERAALAQIPLGQRFGDEVLDRNGFDEDR